MDLKRNPFRTGSCVTPIPTAASRARKPPRGGRPVHGVSSVLHYLPEFASWRGWRADGWARTRSAGMASGNLATSCRRQLHTP